MSTAIIHRSLLHAPSLSPAPALLHPLTEKEPVEWMESAAPTVGTPPHPRPGGRGAVRPAGRAGAEESFGSPGRP